MRGLYVAILCSAFCLQSGCAGSSGRTLQTDSLAAPMPEATARLYFLRTRESRLYRLRGAALTIDDHKAGSVGFGTVSYRDVPPGVHRVSVDTWDSPGRCTQQVPAEAGETLYFEVAPRSASFHAWVAGDAAGTLLDRTVVAGVVGGLMGSMLESYRSDCSGLFAITPLDEAAAHEQMSHLALVLPEQPPAERASGGER